MKKIIFNTAKNLILMFTVMFVLRMWYVVFYDVAHNDPWTGSHEYMPGNAFVLLTQDYN